MEKVESRCPIQRMRNIFLAIPFIKKLIQGISVENISDEINRQKKIEDVLVKFSNKYQLLLCGSSEIKNIFKSNYEKGDYEKRLIRSSENALVKLEMGEYYLQQKKAGKDLMTKKNIELFLSENTWDFGKNNINIQSIEFFQSLLLEPIQRFFIQDAYLSESDLHFLIKHDQTIYNTNPIKKTVIKNKAKKLEQQINNKNSENNSELDAEQLVFLINTSIRSLSALLSWCFYECCKNPDEQLKLSSTVNVRNFVGQIIAKYPIFSLIDRKIDGRNVTICPLFANRSNSKFREKVNSDEKNLQYGVSFGSGSRSCLGAGFAIALTENLLMDFFLANRVSFSDINESLKVKSKKNTVHLEPNEIFKFNIIPNN